MHKHPSALQRPIYRVTTGAGESFTTFSANLARAHADLGARVELVER